MNWLWRVNEWECFSLHSPNGGWIHGWLNWFQKNSSYHLEVAWSFARVLHRCEESYTWPRGHSLTGGLIVAFANTYIHALLRLPSTGLFSHNVSYYIILVIKKRKENLFTVVQLNSKYIQNYSKYIQNYFVWNILLKSLRLKLSISLVFLILSGSPFHSFGPRK